MILKEWSEAQDIYKATLVRSRKKLEAVHALSKAKSYWYVWVAYLVVLLSVILIVL